MKPHFPRYLLYLILIVAIVVLAIRFWPSSPETPTGTLNDAITLMSTGEVVVEDATISTEGQQVIVIQEEESLLVTTGTGENKKELLKTSFFGSTYDLKEYLVDADVDLAGIVIKPKQQTGWNWGQLAIAFLPVALIVFFFWILLRGARGASNQAMNFSHSKARMANSAKSTITFADVAGVDEAKQELQEVVEFLKNPGKFLALGARIPRGVLLIGSPGTGKTLMAKAIAGEAGVPFFSISGSEFVEMFVGVGASRVRDLFDQAKRNAPCIIFIDEIDAVGRHRGAGLGGGHDEREQTLNQILVEMDGFDANSNVIIIAATNRPDILDPALLRPGRFDRQVVLDRPDVRGRKAILEVHMKGKVIDDSVNVETLAKQTAGFSGADLANLVNEAAILAGRRDKKSVTMSELEEAIDRVLAGPEKRSRVIVQKEKEITAYHESGHALVARMLANADPVHKISIIARGLAAGYTRLLPSEERYLWTQSQFNDMIAVTLAGHASEQIIFGEVTTGASSDLEQATKMAHKMVTEYGMSEKLGPRTFGHKEELVFLGKEISEQRNYSERLAQEIDEEVHDIIQRSYAVARDILTQSKTRLTYIAKRLITDETLEGETLEHIFSDPIPTENAATSS